MLTGALPWGTKMVAILKVTETKLMSVGNVDINTSHSRSHNIF